MLQQLLQRLTSTSGVAITYIQEAEKHPVVYYFIYNALLI